MATKPRHTEQQSKRSTTSTTTSRSKGRTKADTILRLIKRSKGAAIAELQGATGWQAHSLRAALTRLRNNGHEVVRTKDNGGITRYRIVAEK